MLIAIVRCVVLLVTNKVRAWHVYKIIGELASLILNGGIDLVVTQVF